MGLITRMNEAYRREGVGLRFRERALAVHTPLGGGEIRPTRIFLWLGRRGDGGERIYPLGRPPRPVAGALHPRHLDFGSWGLSFLGNPAVTLSQFAYYFLRRPEAPAVEAGRAGDSVTGERPGPDHHPVEGTPPGNGNGNGHAPRPGQRAAEQKGRQG